MCPLLIDAAPFVAGGGIKCSGASILPGSKEAEREDSCASYE